MYMERRKYTPQDRQNRRLLLRAAVAVPLSLSGMAILAACGASPEEIAARQQVFGSQPPGEAPLQPNEGSSPFTRSGSTAPGGGDGSTPVTADGQPVTPEMVQFQEGSV